MPNPIESRLQRGPQLSHFGDAAFSTTLRPLALALLLLGPSEKSDAANSPFVPLAPLVVDELRKNNSNMSQTPEPSAEFSLGKKLTLAAGPILLVPAFLGALWLRSRFSREGK